METFPHDTELNIMAKSQKSVQIWCKMTLKV